MISTRQPVILHIASGDLWAGAEVQLFTLANTLKNLLGIQTYVVLLNHGILEDRLRMAGIQVKVLDESRLSSLHILYRLVSTLRELKPDVVHTHRLKENILGSIAARAAGNIPSLRTVHGNVENPTSWLKPHRKLIYIVDRACGRYLQNKIISVSGELALILRKTFPPGKVHTIVNGIDVAALQTRRIVKQSRNGNRLKIGFAGRLVRVKRADIFIKTAHYLQKHHPETQADFYIYGDGPERAALESLSKELGVAAIVRFEGHCHDMPDKLSELDILLITSDHEGLPMVLLEAMAVKTVVIAHAVGGITKVLDGGSCGVLVREQSPAAFAAEICKLADSPEKRSLLAQNALDRVTRLYSSRTNAASYLTVYDELKYNNE